MTHLDSLGLGIDIFTLVQIVDLTEIVFPGLALLGCVNETPVVPRVPRLVLGPPVVRDVPWPTLLALDLVHLLLDVRE